MIVRTEEQNKVVAFWKAVEMNHKVEYTIPLPEGVRAERKIPYIQDYNIDHMLCNYYPKSMKEGEKLPTVINIHGGGWLFGHVEDSEQYMAELASMGYAVMGMGYRLIPTTDMQGIVQDIYTALHWLENCGPRRGFDLEHVMLTGDSAGAHLSLLVACIQESEELQKIYGVTPVSFKIGTVGISCPCAEMDALFLLPAGTEEEKVNLSNAYRELMLGDMGENAPWSKALSFSEYIRFVPDVKKLPPVFFIGSENESLHYQTLKILKVMDEKQVNYKKMIWKKEDGAHLMHVFNVEFWSWYESKVTNKKMLEFFRKQTGLNQVGI